MFSESFNTDKKVSALSPWFFNQNNNKIYTGKIRVKYCTKNISEYVEKFKSETKKWKKNLKRTEKGKFVKKENYYSLENEKFIVEIENTVSYLDTYVMKNYEEFLTQMNTCCE